MNPYQRPPPYHNDYQPNYNSNYQESGNEWRQSTSVGERVANWSSSGLYGDGAYDLQNYPYNPPVGNFTESRNNSVSRYDSDARSLAPEYEFDRQSLSSASSFNYSERQFDRSGSNSVVNDRAEHSRASFSSMLGMQSRYPEESQKMNYNSRTARGSVSSMSSDVFRDNTSYHSGDSFRSRFNSANNQINQSSMGDSGYSSSFRSRETSQNTTMKSVADRLGPPRELDGVSIQGPVLLDKFNCDLFVTVSEDGYTAYDLGEKGFQHLWGGIRATHGVNYGKVAFEVKLEENLVVEFEESEKSQGGAPHVTRVGWSEDFTDLQLGEVANSYGYGGTAKKSQRRQFLDYGVKFGVGDVVTCYLDKRDDGSAEISYAVNGRFLGYAFQISTSNKPLFPHISIKNMKFTVNFGAYENYFPLENGFEMIDYCQHLAPGFKSGDYAEDYEWIMLIGLPAAGKTTYIEDFVKKHPDKKYVVLGTNSIMEKMRVCNLFRKFNYHERFEKLFQLANEILKLLMKFSERKLRNYILDQTNVFQSARIRKKKFYEGYQCHCYVFVCNAEELERRTVKTGRESGKWVPVNAVMNMKKNFKLPDDSERWRSISYVEENEESSRTIVAGFNKEANLFYRNGENNLPENNEVPHPRYKRMVESDPRGLNDGPPFNGKTTIGMNNDSSRDYGVQSKRARIESNSSFASSMGRESNANSSNNSEYLLTSRFTASIPKPQNFPPERPFAQNRIAGNSVQVKQEPFDGLNSQPSKKFAVGQDEHQDMSKFQAGFINYAQPEIKREAPAQPPFARRPFPMARGMRLDSMLSGNEEHFPENRDPAYRAPPFQNSQAPYYGEPTGLKNEFHDERKFPNYDRNNFAEKQFDNRIKQEPQYFDKRYNYAQNLRGNNGYGY